jgi:Caspase domain
MEEVAKSRAVSFRAEPEVRLNGRGRSVVAVIGIDQYKYWPRLKNAVSDALGVQRRLIEQFGFVEAFPPLINERATRDAILSVTNDQLRQFVQEGDDLLLFFAGHGHTRESQIGKRKVADGYLVPVDAHVGTDERWSEYVAIEPLLIEIAKLPARHVLVILDACHSGFALGDAMKAFRGGAERYSDDLASRVSRKVITSAMHDQLAQDGGPIAGHSLFAGTLIDGLNWGGADLDGNGFVTSSELGLYLQQSVAQASESLQTPDFGSFHLDDRGELCLSLKSQTFDALKARALACLHGGDFSIFRELVHKLAELRPFSPETLYLQYRFTFLEGDVGAAIDLARQLLTLDLSKGAIPLSKHDLNTLTVVLPFWRRLLEIPDGGFPLQTESLLGSNVNNFVSTRVTRLTEVDACEMASGDVLRLRIVNATDKQIHVYAVLIDPDGRPSWPPLWDDDELLWNGLAPGTTQDSFPFALAILGLWEMRLYSSLSRIRYLVSAPATASRTVLSVDALNRFDWSHVQMRALRYSVRPTRLRSGSESTTDVDSPSVSSAEEDPLVRLITRVRLESSALSDSLQSKAAWERQIRDVLGKNDFVHFVEATEQPDLIVRLVDEATFELIDGNGKIMLKRSSRWPEIQAAQMINHLSVYRVLRQYKPRAKQQSQQAGLVVELSGRCGPESDPGSSSGRLTTLPFDQHNSIPVFFSGEAIMLRIHNHSDSSLSIGVFILGADWSVQLLEVLDVAAKRDNLISIPTWPEGSPGERLWLVKVIGSRQPEPYADFQLPPLGEDYDGRREMVGLPRDGLEVVELTLLERET